MNPVLEELLRNLQVTQSRISWRHSMLVLCVSTVVTSLACAYFTLKSERDVYMLLGEVRALRDTVESSRCNCHSLSRGLGSLKGAGVRGHMSLDVKPGVE
jgi:hypothetical protein